MTAAITADHVAKTYRVRRERQRTLKEWALRQYAPPVVVEALKDVSFEIAHGETFGAYWRSAHSLSVR